MTTGPNASGAARRGAAAATSTRRAGNGYTLVECALVLAVVAVLAALALPSFRGSELRMARLDAVAALTRVQVAQEQHRAAHGLYAADLSALVGVGAASPQGRYTLSIATTGPEAYTAVAAARGGQARDTACPALTLAVSNGFPHNGPSPACWNQ